MYDQQARKWRSDCEAEELLRWSQEPANIDLPEACFLRASHLLSQGSRGDHLGQAMALLEKAGDYPPALFARGQLSQWGWGVHKDRKAALEWYRKAAALGSEPARQALAKVRRNRLIAGASIAAAVVCVCLAAALPFLMARAARRIIRVHPGASLVEAASGEQFREEVEDLIAEYDSEAVIAGEEPTCRVVLRFEGNRLDLSAYPAQRVIALDDNRVVLQFTSEEDALRCIEELSRLDAVVYVEMDRYESQADATPGAQGTGQQNGRYSWGVVDLGLDRLSDYVAEDYPDRELIVAVVDSGVRRWDRNVPRVLEGRNMVTGGAGTSVPAAHGTHVAGTILDGTRGTGVVVLPVDVFNGRDGASALAIANGVDYAVEQGALVINMSLGGPHASAKDDAVRRALAAGVTVVVAAGNESGDTEEHCPAHMEEAIVVGAYDIDREIAWFSNYGDAVDLCAPGVDILSDDFEEEDYLRWMDGTSMATPHVSALAALMRILYPDAAPAQIEKYMKDYCNTDGDALHYGEGAPDATSFIEGRG